MDWLYPYKEKIRIFYYATYRRLYEQMIGKNPLPFLFQIPLILLSAIYKLVYLLREILYGVVLKRQSPNVCTIFIGNLTCGGTGKTTISMSIAECLLKEDYKVALISMFEDESTLFRNRFKDKVLVFTAKNRESILQRLPKDYIAIFDDALQYRRIKPHMRLLLINAACPFGNGWLIPMGYLRQPQKKIKDIDCIIVTKSNLATQERLREVYPFIEEFKVPIFWCNYKIDALYSLNPRLVYPPSSLRGLEVVVFTCVADPYSVAALLETEGAKIYKMIQFPDHHRYTKEDIERLKSYEKPLITTEKDLVNLNNLSGSFDYLILKIKLDDLSFLDFVKGWVKKRQI